MNEHWLPVVGYEGYYEVSDLGRVRSVDRVLVGSDEVARPYRGHSLSVHVDDHGYSRVNLWRENRTKRQRVHRLVALAFLGEPEDPSFEVCHNNGNPGDNRVENLRWDTRSGNIFDQVRHGTHNQASKTHCPQGHEYTPENTIMLSGDRRECRECRKARKKKVRRRDKARGLAAGDSRHGTLQGYNSFGCKCERCRDSYRAYRRTYRAGRAA